MGNMELLALWAKVGWPTSSWPTDRNTNELLAIKLLSTKQGGNHQMVDRFHSKALVGERLDHAAITKVMFLKYLKGVLCLAVEYVPGMDVYRHVKLHGVWNWDLLHLIGDLAIALDHGRSPWHSTCRI